MIHFNELYITEDGKNLVVDVGIDDIYVYDKCYIESVSVAPASKLCGDDKTGCDFITVYSGGTGLTYVDMDDDGNITDCDIAIIDRINDLIDKMLPDNTSSAYDINGDGFVSLADYACIISVLKGESSANDYPNTPDINGDGEVKIADANNWMGYILEGESKLTDEEKVFMFD